MAYPHDSALTPSDACTLPSRPVRLTPTAVRLAALLAELTPAQRTTVTNDQLAARLGVSSRSVTTALSRLQATGRLRIAVRRGHPHADRTGRTLTPVTGEAGERR